jgi:hypothetical protein
MHSSKRENHDTKEYQKYLELGILFLTLARFDQSVWLASPCGPVFDLAKYVMQVCPLSYLPKTPLKALVVGYEKKANSKAFGEVSYTLSDRVNHLRNSHLFCKTHKPLDRWLIKERMIGDSIIIVLSCNQPRTSKS